MRVTCNCEGCGAPHTKKATCRRLVKWYAEFHRVDDCTKETHNSLLLCDPCFQSFVDLAQATIAWGFQGARAAVCATCDKPLVRLSAIINDVGKLSS